jgi:pyrroline-5-carboxylate reductase
MNVLVIGAGKMTSAILEGFVGQMDFSQWMIYSPGGQSSKSLAQKIGAQVIGSLHEAKEPDWILVGCKPQQLQSLASNLPESLRGALFVSMLAAIPEKKQLEVLGASKLIRIMPNLPVKHREGVTLMCGQSAAGELKEFQKLFALLGMSLIVGEPELEELTLLTGSGPALVYEFTRSLAEGFTALTPTQREILAVQMLYGAALNAHKEKGQLQTKIDAVTSKGGVTIAVLEGWRRHSFLDTVKAGLLAGQERARAIAKEII